MLMEFANNDDDDGDDDVVVAAAAAAAAAADDDDDSQHFVSCHVLLYMLKCIQRHWKFCKLLDGL